MPKGNAALLFSFKADLAALHFINIFGCGFECTPIVF